MSFLSLRASSSSLPALVLRSSSALIRSQPHTPLIRQQSRPLATNTPTEDEPEKKVPFLKKLFNRTQKVAIKEAKNEAMEEEYELQEAYHSEVTEQRRKAEVRKLRNKSRLSASHRNILRGVPPLEGVEFELNDLHRTKAFKMGVMGHFGPKATGIKPSAGWPNALERFEAREYEKVLYDGKDLKQLIEDDRAALAREREEVRER